MKFLKIAAATAALVLATGSANAATQQWDGSCTISSIDPFVLDCVDPTSGAFQVQVSGQTMVSIIVGSGSGMKVYEIEDWFAGLFSASSANGVVAGATAGSTSPVPLPAAAWMLIAALGGLFMVKRRKAVA